MPLQPAPFPAVTVTSNFWSPIQRRAWSRTIPAILEAQKSSQHWYCLTWTHESHPMKPHPFWDSDIYKWLEAACTFLILAEQQPKAFPADQAVNDAIEEAVKMIVNAQHEDGYLNSYYTVHSPGLAARWTNLRDMHELYCLGHLIEATVAYTTLHPSDPRLLHVCQRAIAHITSRFGPHPPLQPGYPGHQEIELALLRLHALTADPAALALARYFVFERGRRDSNDETFYDREARARGGDPYDHLGSEMKHYYRWPRDYAYQQADVPVIQQREIQGHAVRACYYYAAVTDLVKLGTEGAMDATGDDHAGVTGAKTALDALWRDMVDTKLYITGGVGNVGQWEGFGDAYRLPDTAEDGCYCETCATFALINWCQRLLSSSLRAEYADVMERGLYNAFLGSLSADGEAFYYENPLRTRKKKERSRWFGVACCPPNVAKLLASLGGLIWGHDAQAGLLAANLYVGSEFKLPGTDVVATMETNMPWSGDVVVRVSGRLKTLALRIPGWTHDQGGWKCSADGQLQDGYLYISDPPPNEDIKLTLSMKPQRVYANRRTGKDEIAIVRGPVVYCIEDVDNGGVNIDELALADVELQEQPATPIAGLEGVVPIAAAGKQLQKQQTDESAALYTSRPWKYETTDSKIMAIPYFLRANRGGDGMMRVWTKRLDG